MGSVFSPWYAAARARGAAPAASFPAVNVALYRAGGARWVMTERGEGALRRDPGAITIGASGMRWEGGAIVIEFDERCATFPSPVPRRLAGRVRIEPRFLDGSATCLDPDRGRHRWCPIAPSARAVVELDAPAFSFRGEAYVDANHGDEPVETGMRGWTWCRMAIGGQTTVAYHSDPRAGAPLAWVRRYEAGGAREIAGVQLAPLARTGWGIERTVACDRGARPRLVRTLEDTPFYARNVVHIQLGGQAGLAIHESLDARRFAERWVRFLLPFRSRREVGPR